MKADLARTGSTRCAIYTRKSSDEGLEQEFNSLDAQREACEARKLTYGNLVAIPAIAETKNTRRYREDLWLGDLDSNQEERSQMGYSAGRLALRGGEGCCASG